MTKSFCDSCKKEAGAAVGGKLLHVRIEHPGGHTVSWELCELCMTRIIRIIAGECAN